MPTPEEWVQQQLAETAESSAAADAWVQQQLAEIGESAAPNPALQPTDPNAIAAAASQQHPNAPPTPTPTKVDPGTWKDTLADGMVGGQSGMMLGWDDEIRDLIPGGDDAASWRARKALAASRSPNANFAGKLVGGLATGVAGTALAPAAAAIPVMTGMGAAAGAGDSHNDRAAGALEGAAYGAAGGVVGQGLRVLGGASKGINSALQKLVANPQLTSLLQKGAPKALEHIMPAIGSAAGAAVGNMVDSPVLGAGAGTWLGREVAAPIVRDLAGPIGNAAAKHGPDVLKRLASVAGKGELLSPLGKNLVQPAGVALSGVQRTGDEAEQSATRGLPSQPAMDVPMQPQAQPNMLARTQPQLRQYPQQAPAFHIESGAAHRVTDPREQPRLPAPTPAPRTDKPGPSTYEMVKDLSGQGQQSSLQMSALDRIAAELELETDEAKKKAKFNKAILTDPNAREAINGMPIAEDNIGNIYQPREGYNNSF